MFPKNKICIDESQQTMTLKRDKIMFKPLASQAQAALIDPVPSTSFQCQEKVFSYGNVGDMQSPGDFAQTRKPLRLSHPESDTFQNISTTYGEDVLEESF